MVSMTVREKIRQRRAQMLVHSRLYYELDHTEVDDHTWQRWADELRQLQNENPDARQIGFFDEEFSGWTGDSGYHLPLKDPRVVAMTLRAYGK
jgi:NAD-dependent DNA ligase